METFITAGRIPLIVFEIVKIRFDNRGNISEVLQIDTLKLPKTMFQRCEITHKNAVAYDRLADGSYVVGNNGESPLNYSLTGTFGSPYIGERRGGVILDGATLFKEFLTAFKLVAAATPAQARRFNNRLEADAYIIPNVEIAANEVLALNLYDFDAQLFRQAIPAQIVDTKTVEKQLLPDAQISLTLLGPAIEPTGLLGNQSSLLKAAFDKFALMRDLAAKLNTTYNLLNRMGVTIGGVKFNSELLDEIEFGNLTLTALLLQFPAVVDTFTAGAVRQSIATLNDARVFAQGLAEGYPKDLLTAIQREFDI